MEFSVTHNHEISLGRRAHFLDGISDTIETHSVKLIGEMEHSRIVEPTNENEIELRIICVVLRFFGFCFFVFCFI